jgi:hypothetical protein
VQAKIARFNLWTSLQIIQSFRQGVLRYLSCRSSFTLRLCLTTFNIDLLCDSRSSTSYKSAVGSLHDMAANAPPSQALDAVLVESIPMPDGSQKVEDFDFDTFGDRPISATELLQGMRGMGFQASSVGEAVRIINEMVSRSAPLAFAAALLTPG